jgi:hypothetical protein
MTMPSATKTLKGHRTLAEAREEKEGPPKVPGVTPLSREVLVIPVIRHVFVISERVDFRGRLTGEYSLFNYDAVAGMGIICRTIVEERTLEDCLAALGREFVA